MKILAVIPSRYGSQRLMGKPLLEIGDKPMVQLVYERAVKSKCFDEVLVATDDERIINEVHKFGGKAVMTSNSHESGTDRVAEVAERYKDFDVVVNVQGDQPFVKDEMLNALIEPFKLNKGIKMSTVASPISAEDYENPNSVKVLVDKKSNAIYFSRASIPYFRNKREAPVFAHIGLYAYEREFLIEFSKMETSQLEVCEGLEQLRVLENGNPIYVSIVNEKVIEVNTKEDLISANAYVNL